MTEEKNPEPGPSKKRLKDFAGDREVRRDSHPVTEKEAPREEPKEREGE
jgi:hypothetical protein